MRVTDLLKNCVILLQKKELIKAITDSEYEVERENDEINLLLKCYNIIINEIATEYFEPVYTESFTNVKGEILYSDFLYVPTKIKSVTNSFNNNVRYDVTPSRIKVDYPDVEISYNYVPNVSSFDDDYIFENTLIQQRVVCYGIISEYYLINSLFKEAEVWNKRYKDSLLACLTPKKLKKLKCRVWGT